MGSDDGELVAAGRGIDADNEPKSLMVRISLDRKKHLCVPVENFSIQAMKDWGPKLGDLLVRYHAFGDQVAGVGTIEAADRRSPKDR